MSARPHVTITLGRSGQFVKRARPGADFGQSDHDISSGRHQPTRERSGSDMTDSSLYGSQHKNKRIRTENSNSSSDRQIGRNDLRFKLINKSLFRKTGTGGGGQNDVDLREKLSRIREISFKSNPRRNLREFRTSGTVRRLPPTRSVDDLLQLDSKRKSYSSRTVDERRHRSPDKLIRNARPFYSPRSHEDASRHSSFIKNGRVNSSRTISSVGKTGLLIDAGKSGIRDSSSGSIMHRSTHKPEEPFTVSSFLNALGLGKYAILFQAEEIDMTSLREMGDHDLKELGIPMGPRKKILLAVLSHTKYHYL